MLDGVSFRDAPPRSNVLRRAAAVAPRPDWPAPLAAMRLRRNLLLGNPADGGQHGVENTGRRSVSALARRAGE